MVWGCPSGLRISSSPGRISLIYYSLCSLSIYFLDLGDDKEQGEVSIRWVWLWFMSVLPPGAESTLALWDIH